MNMQTPHRKDRDPPAWGLNTGHSVLPSWCSPHTFKIVLSNSQSLSNQNYTYPITHVNVQLIYNVFGAEFTNQ